MSDVADEGQSAALLGSLVTALRDFNVDRDDRDFIVHSTGPAGDLAQIHRILTELGTHYDLATDDTVFIPIDELAKVEANANNSAVERILRDAASGRIQSTEVAVVGADTAHETSQHGRKRRPPHSRRQRAVLAGTAGLAAAGLAGGLTVGLSGGSPAGPATHQASHVSQVTTVDAGGASGFSSNIAIPMAAEDIPVKVTATFDIGFAVPPPAGYTPPTEGPFEGPGSTTIPAAYKEAINSSFFNSTTQTVDFEVKAANGGKLSMEQAIAQFKTLLAATQPQVEDSPFIDFNVDTDATITVQDGKVIHSSIMPEQLAELTDLSNGSIAMPGMKITVMVDGKPVQASISGQGVNGPLTIIFPDNTSAKESKSLIDSQEKTADVLNNWLTGQLQNEVGSNGIYVQVSTTDNQTYAPIVTSGLSGSAADVAAQANKLLETKHSGSSTDLEVGNGAPVSADNLIKFLDHLHIPDHNKGNVSVFADNTDVTFGTLPDGGLDVKGLSPDTLKKLQHDAKESGVPVTLWANVPQNGDFSTVEIDIGTDGQTTVQNVSGNNSDIIKQVKEWLENPEQSQTQAQTTSFVTKLGGKPVTISGSGPWAQRLAAENDIHNALFPTGGGRGGR